MSNVRVYDFTTKEGLREASQDFVEFMFSDSVLDKLNQMLIDANAENRVHIPLRVLRAILGAAMVAKPFARLLFENLKDAGIPCKFLIKLLLEEGKREGLSQMTIKVDEDDAGGISKTTSKIGSISVVVADNSNSELTIYANYKQAEGRPNILPPSDKDIEIE